MAERIVVLVESDVEAPIAHGFVARHAAVIDSLRRHGDVRVVGITATPGSIPSGVDHLVELREPTPPASDMARLLAATRSSFGRYWIGSELTQLHAKIRALNPTLIVCLTWQRRETVRAVGTLAPTALFAEERLSGAAGRPIRWTFPPSVVSLVEARAQRRVVALARVIAVIGPAEVAWAQAAFHRPVIVVPPSVSPRMITQARDTVIPGDVAVIGNLAEARNVVGLVEIIDEAQRRGWPGGIRFRLVSAAGYHSSIVERGGPNVVLEGAVDDLGPLVAEATCRLVPAFKALGVKTQILQGWAAQVPVVATTRSALTVAGRHEVDLLVGETPSDVVDVLEGLAERQDLEQIIEAGLARAETDYSPAQVDAAVDQVVTLLVKSRR